MESKSLISDLAPYNESVAKLTDGSVGLLKKLFGPSAEVIGHILSDRFNYYRRLQAISIFEKLTRRMDGVVDVETLKLNPRISAKFIEDGTWSDDDGIQEMWSGLLFSSCDLNGSDDNLYYSKCLSDLNSLHAKIINKYAEACELWICEGDDCVPSPVLIESRAMTDGDFNQDRLDAAISVLVNIGIFDQESNRNVGQSFFRLRFTDLGMHFYAVCKGFKYDYRKSFKNPVTKDIYERTNVYSYIDMINSGGVYSLEDGPVIYISS